MSGFFCVQDRVQLISGKWTVVESGGVSDFAVIAGGGILDAIEKVGCPDVWLIIEEDDLGELTVGIDSVVTCEALSTLTGREAEAVGREWFERSKAAQSQVS